MRANVFLYKPEEKIFSLRFLLLVRNWTILNVVVLYQIIRKLDKNNRTLNIVLKFTLSTSVMFSFSRLQHCSLLGNQNTKIIMQFWKTI